MISWVFSLHVFWILFGYSKEKLCVNHSWSGKELLIISQKKNCLCNLFAVKISAKKILFLPSLVLGGDEEGNVSNLLCSTSVFFLVLLVNSVKFISRRIHTQLADVNISKGCPVNDDLYNYLSIQWERWLKIYRKSDICDLLFDNQNNQKQMIGF